MKQEKVRVNDQIRVREVRLIDQDGNQIGIVPIENALEEAEKAYLDLVEISPKAKPPVCKIMDFGKYQYEMSKKEKDSKKKQHKIQVKEIRFRPKTEKHDLDFKIKHIRKFIEQGNRVKATVMFKGRELDHIEFGFEIIKKIVEELEDIAKLESKPKQEGRFIIVTFSKK